MFGMEAVWRTHACDVVHVGVRYAAMHMLACIAVAVSSADDDSVQVPAGARVEAEAENTHRAPRAEECANLCAGAEVTAL